MRDKCLQTVRSEEVTKIPLVAANTMEVGSYLTDEIDGWVMEN